MARRAAPTDPTGPATGPTSETADRALELRARYVELRASTRHAEPGPSAERSLAEAVGAILVRGFAAWATLDVVGESGASERLVEVVSNPDTDSERGAAGLAGVVDRVITGGATETWPVGGEARVAVVGLKVRERPYGALSVGLGADDPALRPLDLAVLEEVAWGLSATLERAALVEEGRRALRATQRLARQLHQLFAASVAVTSAHDDAEIAATLAQSARRIFDADAAVVDLVAPARRATLARGELHASFEAREGFDLPAPDSGRARVLEEWLVVPIEGRHGAAGGALGLRRERLAFSSEDVEVVTLLAQAAATALGARALARGVERSEARLRTLVQTAPIGIVEAGTDGEPRWWNRAAGRILGWPTPGSTPGSTAHPPLVPALRAAFAELAEAVVAGGGPAMKDLVEVELRGRARDLTAAAALVEVPGEPDPTVMVLVDDVTDHRQLRAEVAHAQQMEMRGRVASSVAHDFNNLITLIVGYAEILEREVDGERASEMVHEIQSTAARAARLTAQLQSIGRAPVLEPVVLAPADVVRANAEVLERILGPDVELDLDLDDAAGATRVDAAQFEQMLVNLAMNARDAMPEGGRLRVAVDGVELDETGAPGLGLEAGTFVRVTVTDTGVGMDEETMTRCFDAFFTTKGALRGTGLGLASARRLVEASGGAISVRSAPGAGTTFEALFPVTREAVVVELAAATTHPTRGFASVLVVEDDAGLRRLMAQVLRRNGHEVLDAPSGEEALELAERYEGVIDLLVSDVDLGGLDGPELARRLREGRPGLKVLLTSGTADAGVLEGLEAAPTAFLAKPFRPSALIEAVHDLVTEHTTEIVS
ncbi:MAG TPA: ATP-binding protein [Acidimicrobiales bacterium]|nr:ATP-binding protein [Acidimicrobiales bacterium]